MLLRGNTIAVVEDDVIMGESLSERLVLEGAQVFWWQNCQAAREGLATARPDLVICDIRLPDGTGEDVMQCASERTEAPPFLFMTAYADIDQAVRLMRNGAGDYVTKPFESADFLSRLHQLLPAKDDPTSCVLGVSTEMNRAEQLLRRISNLSAPVLLTGETGSGKEVCARFLHGLRAKPGPFMAVNCAAIPKELLESELFGHEKGAFTGASTRHRGYAERASQGVLFLDEIGELDLTLQAKLLRVFENRSFHRVGGEEALPFRARLICATNADLERKAKAGLFREDLLYRINVLSVAVPGLRARPDDIVWLADQFFDRFAQEQHSCLRGLSAGAAEAMRRHEWPGNVRELRNRLERAVALSPGPWIGPADLFPEKSRPDFPEASISSLETVRDDVEKRHIILALRQAKGGVVAAANSLGISRTTLWEKMRRHGIDVADLNTP